MIRREVMGGGWWDDWIGHEDELSASVYCLLLYKHGESVGAVSFLTTYGDALLDVLLCRVT